MDLEVRNEWRLTIALSLSRGSGPCPDPLSRVSLTEAVAAFLPTLWSTLASVSGCLLLEAGVNKNRDGPECQETTVGLRGISRKR